MRVTIGRVMIGVGLAAVIAVMAWSLTPRPVPVETAPVTTGRFVATVDEDGQARIREHYAVSAPLAGQMARIRLKVGDLVKVDDVVTTIIPSPAPFLDPRTRGEAQERVGAAEAMRDRAAASVERARVQAAQAKRDYDRTAALAQRGTATRQILERDELALRVAERDQRAAEFQLHAAEHDLDQAGALLARYHDGSEAALDRWSVKAPVSGVVLKVAQESEAVVQAGASLLEIGDPLDLEVVVDVLSSDAVEIRPGADVAIERWGGPGRLEGRVRRVEPTAFTKISTLSVEEQRVNVLVDLRASSEDWAGLGDGYRVEARIAVFTQEDAVLVPTGALFRLGETWNVYVAADGRADRRPVAVLRRSGSLTAIAAGLAAGENVIVYPSDRVAAGIRVQVR